ncbi:MAG: SEC-C domain-containing protein, partial [Flavobacteriales bacterium]|nr:SEC-C domain-containing protein [Flavobacteriales bacterium]
MIIGKGNKVNKPCWCGSGKKYKKCHGSIIKVNKVKPSTMDLDLQQEFKKDICYAPHKYHDECDLIINAHSISKSKHLKLIANKKGYVYGFKTSSGIIHANGKIIVSKFSIKNSSTFYGFCAKHDKELFEVIDDEFILDNKQIFLNLYRTISKELYKKRNISNHHVKNMPQYSIGLEPLHAKVYKENLVYLTDYTKLAVRDLEFLKNKLDLKLVDKNFSNIKYYALIINKIPDIMNTFPWNVTIDVNNNKL